MGALEGMQHSWKAAGRSPGDLYATAWTCGCVLADSEQELKQRVEALRGAGWSQIVVAITPGEERAIEDWARIKRAFEQ